MRGMLVCWVTVFVWVPVVVHSQTSQPTTRALRSASRSVKAKSKRAVAKARVSICAGRPSGLVREFKAKHAVAVQGLIRVLEQDRKAIAVYKAKDGSLLWRKVFQKKPVGVHSIHVAGEHTVVYASNRLVSFVTATGYLSGSRWVAFHRHIRNRDGCTFEHREGVCALSCGTTFQMINCHTMHPMSSEYELTQSCFSKGGGCFSFRGLPFGELHGNWMATVEAPKRTSLPNQGRRKQMMVAIHKKTGRIVWESEDAAVLLWHPKESGHSPNKSVCWVVNYAGDARVFDCKTGQLFWSFSQTRKKPLLSLLHRRFRWSAKPRGLLVYSRESVSLRHPKSGEVLWKKKLRGRTVALVQGTPWPSSRTLIQPSLSVQILSPQGKVRRLAFLPEKRTLYVFPNQTMMLQASKEAILLTAPRKQTWTFPFALKGLLQSSHMWVFQGATNIQVARKRDGKMVHTLKGAWQVAALEQDLGAGRILVQKRGAKGQPLGVFQLYRVCLR